MRVCVPVLYRCWVRVSVACRGNVEERWKVKLSGRYDMYTSLFMYNEFCCINLCVYIKLRATPGVCISLTFGI